MSDNQISELQRLFNEARKLPLEKRAAWLAEQGDADAKLVEHVARLLEQGAGELSEIHAALEETRPDVNEQPKKVSESDTDKLVADHSQNVFGDRYQVISEIARGGMGVVLRVRDTNIDRNLAVKMMLPGEHGDQHARDRFTEEARITGQLQHPGIPPVHEVGKLADGQPFFSMKLIEGRTLSHLLNDYTVAQDLPRLLKIVEQVAQTLAYTHAEGVIHRDLKPSNIMVGTFGEVQVMDWGLAKRLRSTGSRGSSGNNNDTVVSSKDSNSSSNLAEALADTIAWQQETPETRTQAGQVLGTLPYMSPEQARGEIERIDERCDVFAIGAVLCMILTGHPPYRATNQTELWKKAQEGDLEDAYKRLEASAGDPSIIVIARECLATEPEQRPSSAAAVAERIGDYLKSLHDKKRRRLVIGMISASVLLVVSGSVVAGWYSHKEDIRRGATADHQASLEVQIVTALDQAEAKRSTLHEQLQDPNEVSRLMSDMRAWKTLVDEVQSSWEQAQSLANTDQSLVPEEMNDRLIALESSLQTDQREYSVAARLDVIRLKAFDHYAYSSSTSTSELEIAMVFQELELNIDVDRPGDVAAGVRRSRIRSVLIAALDMWALIAGDIQRRDRLLSIARNADPDPWRNRLRQPDVWSNVQELQTLADEVLPADHWPQILAILASRLTDVDGDLIPVLRASVAEHPRDYWLRFLLSLYSKTSDQRIGSYQVALNIRPDSSAAHSNLAVELMSKGDWRNARVHCEKAIAFAPTKSSKLRTNLARVLLHDGDLDDAIEQLHLAISTSPYFMDAHRLLMDGFELKGDMENALTHLSAVIAGLDSKAANVLGPNDRAFFYSCRALIRSVSTSAELRDGALAVADAISARQLTRFRGVASPSVMAAAYAEQGDFEAAVAWELAAIIDLRNEEDLDEYGAIQRLQLYYQGKPYYTDYGFTEVATPSTSTNSRLFDDFSLAIQRDPKDAHAYRRRGDSQRLRGKYSTALADYNIAIQLDPMDPHAVRSRGDVWSALGEFPKAIDDYDRAIELASGDSLSFIARAELLQSMGDNDKAMRDFNEVILRSPKLAWAYQHRAILHYESGAFDDALSDFTEAIQIDPNQANLFHGRGKVWREKGNSLRAIDDFQQAAQVSPTWYLPRTREGLEWMKLGEWEKAIECFENVLKLKPDSDYARAKLTECRDRLASHLLREGDVDDGIKQLRMAISKDPYDFKAHRNLMRAFEKKGDMPSALAHLDATIAALDSGAATPVSTRDRAFLYTSRALLRSVSTAKELRDGSEAVADAIIACRLTGYADVASLSVLAAAYAEQGDFEAAEGWELYAIRMLRRRKQDEYDAIQRLQLYYQGKAYRTDHGFTKVTHPWLGKLTVPLDDYDRAIRRDTQDARVYRRRGDSRRLNAEYQKAIEDYDAAIQLDPQDPHAVRSRGDVWRALGEAQKAIDDYDKAIELDADDSLSLIARGDMLFSLGETDKAIQDFNEVIRRSPKYAWPLRRRAFIRKTIGDFNEAIEDYTEAIRLAPDDAPSFHGRGGLWRSKDEPLRALDDFQQAMLLSPYFVFTMFAEGEESVRKREWDKVIEAYDDAIKLSPNNSVFYDARARVLATAPEGQLRNGKQAIRDATRACELSNWENWHYLQTLAAAHAEAGDFETAIRRQTEAMKLNPDGQPFLEHARRRLALYRDSKPAERLPLN